VHSVRVEDRQGVATGTAVEIAEPVSSWNGMAMALAAAQRNEGVLQAFGEAVQIEPEAPLARFNLAVQLERMDRLEAARSGDETFLRQSEREWGLDREQQRAAEAARRLRSPA
jgi:hypothetical protein